MGDGRASAITVMHHPTVHTTCLNRLHTTWYVVMQDKELRPREACNSSFLLDRDDETSRKQKQHRERRKESRQPGYSMVRSSLRSRRRAECHTDLPAGEANNAVNWFLDRDRDRDQGKEKLLEGIIIRRRRKKKGDQ